MSQYIYSVIEAFLNGKDKKIGNTESKDNKLYLFDNKIAWIDINGKLWIQDCGYVTQTTQDRLNKLPGVWLNRTKGQWLINTIGEVGGVPGLKKAPWDGKPLIVGKI